MADTKTFQSLPKDHWIHKAVAKHAKKGAAKGKMPAQNWSKPTVSIAAAPGADEKEGAMC